MTLEDINYGIITMVIVIAWILLDWHGHWTGWHDDDK
jgi:hypothetical protein